MAESKRDWLLTTFAVLFALLAISNFLKLVALTGDTGFVFFGYRLSGAANAVVAPLFGLFLLVYAAGIWRMRRYAVPMAFVYAGYVLINLILFQLHGPKPESAGPGYALFGLVYAVIALGVSFGAAFTLYGRKVALA